MRKIFFLLLLSVIACTVFSQNTVQKDLMPLPSDKINWAQDINIRDHLGRAFRRLYNDVEGDPYFFADWKPGIGKNESGALKGITKIKYDILNLEVGCIVPDGDSMIVQDGFLKEFIINDSMMTGRNYLFRCGYPAIDKNTVNNYYLVLSDGPLQLLQFSKKEINIEKNDLSGATTKQFIQYDNYFIYKDGKLLKWRRDKDYILGLMKDQDKRIADYLNGNRVNFKSIESLTLLFEYYNQQKAF